jgi:hypothetical protein
LDLKTQALNASSALYVEAQKQNHANLSSTAA